MTRPARFAFGKAPCFNPLISLPFGTRLLHGQSPLLNRLQKHSVPQPAMPCREPLRTKAAGRPAAVRRWQPVRRSSAIFRVPFLVPPRARHLNGRLRRRPPTLPATTTAKLDGTAAEHVLNAAWADWARQASAGQGVLRTRARWSPSVQAAMLALRRCAAEVVALRSAGRRPAARQRAPRQDGTAKALAECSGAGRSKICRRTPSATGGRTALRVACEQPCGQRRLMAGASSGSAWPAPTNAGTSTSEPLPSERCRQASGRWSGLACGRALISHLASALQPSEVCLTEPLQPKGRLSGAKFPS